MMGRERDQVLVHREIEVLRRLQSPFIVAFVDFEIFSNAVVHIYMDYCDGGDLRVLLEQEGNFILR
jgi:serine/threonine protein kinase